MNELKTYLCGWLTAKLGPLDPLVSWIDLKLCAQGTETEDRFLPYYALGVAHGLGDGRGDAANASATIPDPHFGVPLLSTVAVTDTMARTVAEQRDGKSSPHLHMPPPELLCRRPESPRCDVIREGRSGTGKLVNGSAVFPPARDLWSRFCDWIVSDGAHARG